MEQNRLAALRKLPTKIEPSISIIPEMNGLYSITFYTIIYASTTLATTA